MFVCEARGPSHTATDHAVQKLSYLGVYIRIWRKKSVAVEMNHVVGIFGNPHFGIAMAYLMLLWLNFRRSFEHERKIIVSRCRAYFACQLLGGLGLFRHFHRPGSDYKVFPRHKRREV
jgi:hypothetical protein